MKKFKLVVAAFVLAGLTLTSCSSDDNSTSTPVEITGKWTPTKTVIKIGANQEVSEDYANNQEGCDKDYVEFSATNSVFKDKYFYKNGANACIEDDAAAPGTFNKSNDVLIINADESNYDGTYKVTTLSNSTLVISFDTQVGTNTVTTSYHFSKV
ncbi:lipocalin family protein [Flavobacterium sp. PLA-1-15]|uniref:lipocalin family protein n=1 Tax=Flavobacterium sp. PLA-1-15 TaxID=3380533 RepID=UPI003B7C9C4B